MIALDVQLRRRVNARFLEAAGERGVRRRRPRRGCLIERTPPNLVLLDADPLADIRNTGRIAAVLVNGRVFDRRALDELRAGVERAAGTTTR